jgi:hypothetical protein
MNDMSRRSVSMRTLYEEKALSYTENNAEAHAISCCNWQFGSPLKMEVTMAVTVRAEFPGFGPLAGDSCQ